MEKEKYQIITYDDKQGGDWWLFLSLNKHCHTSNFYMLLPNSKKIKVCTLLMFHVSCYSVNLNVFLAVLLNWIDWCQHGMGSVRVFKVTLLFIIWRVITSQHTPYSVIEQLQHLPTFSVCTIRYFPQQNTQVNDRFMNNFCGIVCLMWLPISVA